MPYFICDGDERHMNDFEKDRFKYVDPPLDDYRCGAPGCDAMFYTERYINPPKSGTLYKPKPYVAPMQVSPSGSNSNTGPAPFQVGPSMASGSSPSFGSSMISPSAFGISLIPLSTDQISLSPGPMRRYEAQSQALLTDFMAKKKYLFLARNGTFCAYAPRQFLRSLTESVDEPGFVDGVALTYGGCVVGRNEIEVAKFNHYKPTIVKGKTTYPDIVVEIDKVVYAIELKTPPKIDMSKYMTAFYDEVRIRTEDGVAIKRSIVEELQQRRANLPKNYDTVLLIDLYNMNETIESAIKKMKDSIAHFKARQEWWAKCVQGFMFFHGEGEKQILSRRFTLGEMLDTKTDAASTNQQANIKSFFTAKPSPSPGGAKK